MIRGAWGQRLRDDSGALVATLVFITAGFLAVSLTTTWMVSRIEADRTATQGVQMHSAAAEYAQSALATVNANGVAALTVGKATAYPALRATVEVTSRKLDAARGTITIKLRAQSTEARGGAASSTLTLSAAGIAEYYGMTGTGKNKRPVWAAAVDGTPPLSLWAIAPGALVPAEETQ